MVYENAQLINNVCDLYVIARGFQWQGIIEGEEPIH